MSKRFLVAAVVVLTMGGTYSALRAQTPRSVWDGVYTEEQAKRGAVTFDRECAGCHGMEGAGGGMAPALVGSAFSANYDGQTVGALFDRNRTTMPIGREGALSGQQIADITAFMLQVNKFPPGTTELPSQSMMLKSIAYLAEKPAATPASVGAHRGRGMLSANLQQASELMRDGKETDAFAAVGRELESNPVSMQAANMLDVLGATTEARAVFQRLIDAAREPAARAAAERAMAMSFAFDGDCANTVKFEQKVIAYWVTREDAEPHNAFFQEGEMANEAARVCIDAGDLVTAEKWYRIGSELGLKEPAPTTHPTTLWEFRLAHALGRIAARRGDKAEAQRQIVAARKVLDGDPAMASEQERFFPYLLGYVALYTNDLPTAQAELTRATMATGNTNDPFMRCLLAMTYEKLGQQDEALESYAKAFALATAHNPPSAYARRLARRQLATTN